MARSSRIMGELREFQVRWATSEGRHSFVLSSLIAYRIGNGGPNGVSNPNMEIWIPVSPKIAMVLVRDEEGRIPSRNSLDRDKVREVNEYAMRKSRQLASHSEALLVSLVGRNK